MIVHLITNDKFVAGYINFMKTQMMMYEHVFLVNGFGKEWLEGKVINQDQIVRYGKLHELAIEKKIRNILNECEKIIISGFFYFQEACSFWPNKFWRKTYIHFWGGDFRALGNSGKIRNLREFIDLKLKHYCIKKCAGVIFLIEGEYIDFQKITHIKKNHVFVAEMPFDPCNFIQLNNYKNENIDNNIVRIIIGNSNTPSNHHEEVFDMISHLKEANIEIFCPLSYGNEAYRNKVIRKGISLFGTHFHALTEWMSIKEYRDFLSTCDIGIFYNDRQQGMGNINDLLLMGKKVYLRPNTSMFNYFVREGFKVYSTNELKKVNFNCLKEFLEQKNNLEAADLWFENYYSKITAQWKKIFDL